MRIFNVFYRQNLFYSVDTPLLFAYDLPVTKPKAICSTCQGYLQHMPRLGNSKHRPKLGQMVRSGNRELALQNFIEMRDLVADPKFVLRKKIEANFHHKHPEKWLPLHSMVTFSNIPYSEALREGQKQEAIMAKVMKMEGIEHKWDSEEVEKEILKYL
jgi:hypothetical protein